MFLPTLAAVCLCLPLGNPADQPESERLLAALVERAELAQVLGTSHPTRVKCEETIRRLRDAGARVSPEQADRELERALRRREELRSKYGLRHPEVVKVHVRIAVLAGLVGGAAER